MTSMRVIEENGRSATARDEGVCDCGCGTGMAREASVLDRGGTRPVGAIKALYRRALGNLYGPCGCDGSCGCGGGLGRG